MKCVFLLWKIPLLGARICTEINKDKVHEVGDVRNGGKALGLDDVATEYPKEGWSNGSRMTGVATKFVFCAGRGAN